MLSAAERSHPTSEVRGGGREYQPAMAQELPRGATLCPRSEGAAERRYPASEVRGGDERSYPTSEVRGGSWEEIPHAPSPRPRAAAGRSNPTSKKPGLRGRAQEGLEELSPIEGQEGWR